MSMQNVLAVSESQPDYYLEMLHDFAMALINGSA